MRFLLVAFSLVCRVLMGFLFFRNPSMQPLSENPFASRQSAFLDAMQRKYLIFIFANFSIPLFYDIQNLFLCISGNGTNNAIIGGDRVHDSRFMESGAWHYPNYSREQFPAAMSEAYRVNQVTAADDILGVPNWSRGSAPKDVGTLPAAALPPLPPGRIGAKNGSLHPPPMNNGTEIPLSSTSKNGETSVAAPPSFPDSISRLMDAVSRHPAGDLDYSKLKAILREQRKSYKRRLEREKAKREALEDLLVKLNSTPRLHPRSFSNSSSTASTVRNMTSRRHPGENGRSSADLGDVVLNSLRSNSIDGNSTNSEDAFLLELIQQHLRMKQALIGHVGKRTTGSSSTSGGEQEHRDCGTVSVNGANGLKMPAHFPNGADEDDIPMGGEAASGANGTGNLAASTSARLRHGANEPENGDPYFTAPPNLTKSKSVDYGQANGGHGLIDKETLKLMLDNNSSTGSENGRSSSSERRKQRRKWDRDSSRRGSRETLEREGVGSTARTTSGRRQGTATTTPRPSVAFFVPAEMGKSDEVQNGPMELKEAKPVRKFVFGFANRST